MNKEINEFKKILNGSYGDKRGLIVEGLYLNIFVYDKNKFMRYYVAREGYGYNILQYDKDDTVRYCVAINTTDKSILKHLSNDIDEDVRNKSKYSLKVLGYE